MKKYYSSPEFDVLKVDLVQDVLEGSPTESIPETIETQDPSVETVDF